MLERPFLAAFLCGWFALAVGQPGAPADLRKPAPEPPMRAEEKARRAEEEAASAKRRAERARQEAERAFAQAKRERVQRSAKDVYAEGLALEREGRPVHAWIRYHEAGGYGNARAAARLAEIYEAGTALDLEREAARGGDSAAERRLQTLQKEDPAGLAQVYAAESRKWRDAASVFGAGAAKDGSGQVLPRLFAVAQALEAEGHREALDAYREAVRLGSGKSAKRLFHIYSRGTAEVPLDRGEAAKWQHA
jgi:hypothetical protein